MTTTRVGYVGVEHHHRDPYFAIASNLGVDVTAVCEPGRDLDVEDVAPLEDRPDEITGGGDDVVAVARGAEAYADPEAMFETADVDVAWITYRNDATPDIVAAAVERGIHVICEKPIARTAADLQPIAERAKAAGVTVSPTTFYRTNPSPWNSAIASARASSATSGRSKAGSWGASWPTAIRATTSTTRGRAAAESSSGSVPTGWT